MGCRTEPVLRVSKEIDSYGPISSPSKLVAQPAVASPQIQDSLSIRRRIEHPAHDVVVAPGSNFPLATVMSGRILMRQSKVVALVLASATFSRANVFVVVNEVGVVSEPAGS